MLFKNYEQIINNGLTKELKKTRKDVLDVLNAGVEAVDPYKSVKKCFNEKLLVFKERKINTADFENIYVVGFGKASIGMAQAVYDSIKISEGVVITNNPNGKVKNKKITTIVGSHPIPSENSIFGADKILGILKKCKENDLLIVLISGGGSALLCKPRISLESLQKLTDMLLKSGADINEINTIRKHLSYVKGGQLLRYAKCTVVSMIISDVVGNPIGFIASGPTYPDSTTFDDAKNILEKYKLWEKIPIDVRKILIDGVNSRIVETPKKDDPIFSKTFNFIVANNEIACNAARIYAEEIGYKAMVITTSLTGEARIAGRFFAEKAKNYMSQGEKIVFIAGGETTVTIKGRGVGGRNQEVVLGSLEEIAESNVVFASFATDGVDGKSDAAGAIADGNSFERAKKQNLDPILFLGDNDSYVFFRELNDLLFTGSTGTNVMDIQIFVKNG